MSALSTIKKTEVLSLLCRYPNGHTLSCWVVAYRKERKNEYVNFWPKNWSRSLKKLEYYWPLTREHLEQYLTKKQNGYL